MQGMRHELPARRELRLRPVLRTARGHLRLLRRSTPPRRGARSRPARTRSGAMPTSCPSTRGPRDRARAGLHAADPRRAPGRAARRRARSRSRTTPPTRPTRSRTGSSASRSPRRASSASRSSPAPRPATSRTRSPPMPPPRASSPTSSCRPTSRSRRSSRPASTARTLIAVRRQLRRRQPALHRAFRRAALGVRQRQPAPLLRGGLQDARLRDRRAARLRAAGPRRVPGRLGIAVHEDRRAASRSGSSSAWSRASCRPSTARRPRAAARSRRLRGGPGRLQAAASRHDRQVASRSATRPTASSRSSWRARPAASIDSVTDEEIVDGIRLLAETTGHLHRDRRRRDHAVLESSPSGATIGAGRAGGAGDHRRGPEDPRRGARARSRRTRSSRPRELRTEVESVWTHASSGGRWR